MSVKALDAVFEHVFRAPSHKAVMVVLADRADEGWSCYPGQERIAADMQLGVRTVRRALRELEDDGIIRRQHRSAGGYRTSDRYFLNREAIEALPATVAASLPAKDDTPHRPPRPKSPATTAREPSVREPSVVEPPPVLASQGHPPEGEFALIAPIPIDRNADFDRFWKAYPRRTSKEAARKAWTKALTKTTALALIDAAQRMTDWPDLPEDHHFIPHPATWLNRARWEDDLAETYPPPKTRGVDWDEVYRLADAEDERLGIKA